VLLRYCNVDFIILAALVGIMLLRIVLTYDIACQWSKNFHKRMEEFPPEMQISETTKVDVAVPSWHINGHGESCRNNFNLSYMEGAARTVGEDVETIWAGTNPLAPSIREMGPAARHDTLNDHWNGWNFRKVVQFRTFLFLFSSFVYHILINISSHVASETFQRSNRDERQASRHIQPVIGDVFRGNYQ
jgi:hypothetical protein